MQLSEIEFYKILEEKKDEKTKRYKSVLPLAEHDMGSFLENIKRLFPDYPDHGIEHSGRILNKVYEITSSRIKERLSSLDIIILIFSALFHDTGMALYNNAEYSKEEIRNHHPQLAKTVIEKYFDNCLANLPEKERIKNAVIFVCEAHGMTLEELINSEKFDKPDRIDSFIVHFDILAFMLRIGDLLDLESDRVNRFRMMMFGDDLGETSYNHNIRNLKVERYYSTPEKLQIEVKADNLDQYKIWYDWFEYLRLDIEKFNAIFAKDGLCFPIPEYQIFKPDGTSYSLKRLRFELDEKGGMWDIISKTVYTDDLDFLRELIQNAIDAALKVIYSDSRYKLEYPSPRSWGKNITPITVCYSADNSMLYVIDKGIGMNSSDLESFLFKISCSGTVERKNRPFDFPGIARFGIGFISCIVNADSIKIYTSNTKREMNMVSLASGRNSAFIEKEKNENGYIGTTISLKIKHPYAYKEIKKYIHETFKYPSVQLKIINLDVFEKNIKLDGFENEIMEFHKNPYEFDDLFTEEIEKKQSEKTENRKLMADVSSTQKTLGELRKFGQENLYSFLKDVSMRNEYNSRVEKLYKEMERVGVKDIVSKLEFPSTVKNDDVDAIWTNLVNKFATYDLKLSEEYAKLERKSEQLDLSIDIINYEQLSNQNDWKYYVLFFDDSFKAFNVKKSMNPISIKKGMGIILIKNIKNDFEKGIEYETINGFMFENGCLCKRIVQLATSVLDNTGYHEHDIHIGLNGTCDNVLDELIERGTELYDDRDYFEYVNDYENPREVTISQRYDEVAIYNNEIVKNRDKLLSGRIVTRYGSKRDDEYISENIIDERLKTDIEARDLLEIANSKSDFVYQDGISIPWDINKIFPLGLFRMKCNLTAGARLKLNVTRHKPTEIRADIEEWMKETGNYIQTSILEQLDDSLSELDLSVECNDLMWKPEEIVDFFSKISYENLQSILKKRNSNITRWTNN